MYARTIAGWPLTPMVKKILIINVAIWLPEIIVVHWVESMAPLKYFALTPLSVYPRLMVWQLFTYMWLHSPFDWVHILFNSLFLWMFGGTLEYNWGSKHFLRFYLICGVGAGLIVFLTGLLFSPDTPVLGASGAIYGLVTAWAIPNWNRHINVFNLFVIKGKFFVLFPIGVAVIEFLMRAQGVSHAAHLGGMAIGALLVTGYWRPSRLQKKLRYWWLRRKLKVIEDQERRNRPPNGGYWH